jgi:hypothetical protein
MPKTKISEFSATPANNTDIDSINIAEGCAPSGINDAIRELMAQLKDFQVGSAGDPVTVGGVLTVQAGSASTPALTTAGDTNTGIFFPAADTIAFAEGGVEAMRLDASGNMGLASTPAAWASGQGAMQFKSGGLSAWSLGGVNGYLYSNAYYDGSTNRYVNNGFANSYAINNGGGLHAWFTAPSGTAGNAITFTQAMTLDASGNLAVGITTPTFADGKGIHLNNASGAARFHLTNNTTGTASTDGSEFTVAGSDLYIINNESATMQFWTASTERARIESGGNFFIGATSGTSKVEVFTGDNQNGLNLRASNASYGSTGIQLLVDRNTTNNSFYALTYYNVGRGAYAFLVADSGNVTNTNNSYGAISDIKLKENIVDATPKLAGLMQVKVRNYNLKSDPSHKQLGVIAQELETVFPTMVDESPDKDAEGNALGTTTKQVKYSVFVPMLIKAIQEQQAIIESLKARLDAANL